MKRYMTLVNCDGGTVEAPMDEWKRDEVEAPTDYYRALNKELRETGELVEVEALAGPDLDRTLWDRAPIAEGTELVDLALGRGTVGEYQLQAAIAAVHDRAATAADTEWPQILALYGRLDQMTANPIVTLNRAVAAAMAESPAAGLALLETLEGPLAGHYRLDAVRAHLLEPAGDTAAAQVHYRAAAEQTTSPPERRFLRLQAARLNAATTEGD
jgi:predicted RNA polymerase sigma factor